MLFIKPAHNIWCFLGLAAISAQGVAGNMGDIKLQKLFYQPLVTLTIGPDFVQKGRAQTISLLPPFQNHYTNTKSSETVADAGGFIGVEHFFSDKFGAQLGVSGYIDSELSPSGHVWRFASPEFDTLSYAYKVQHARVMAEGKFITSLESHKSAHPYVSCGLGAAFNQAKNYQETPLIAGAVPMSPFVNHTQTSFAWSIGAGVDYALNPHIRLGAGYQFSDLGSVSLGRTYAAITEQTLSFPHLYANQLRFQLTYLV